MTITLELPEDLARRLAAAGIAKEAMNRYAIAALAAVAESAGEITASDSRPRPRTGAELIAELEAKGVLTGYGDPAIDSPELARQLRESVWQRKQEPTA